MMQNVYVIKVKTKPPLSSLYPSERRYSASTVGGLSFVHFGLGALSLLLGTFALSLQGPILAVACLVPFVTGLLAWRRWYIDRNIAIFFYGSLFSLIAAILCFVATVSDLTTVSDDTVIPSWTLREMFERSHDEFRRTENLTIDTSNDGLHSRKFNVSEDNFTDTNKMFTNKNVDETFMVSDPDIINGSKNHFTKIEKMEKIQNQENNNQTLIREDDGDEEEILLSDQKKMETTTDSAIGITDTVDRSSEIADRVLSFWHKKRNERNHAKTLLTVNVLVAALLEIFWSLLSARIALRGMMNRLPETGYCSNVTSRPDATTGPKRKPPPPRPDILDHDRVLSERLQHVSALHESFRSNGPKLPLPESSREFRERVERFLANQAAHRVVEGSCT